MNPPNILLVVLAIAILTVIAVTAPGLAIALLVFWLVLVVGRWLRERPKGRPRGR